MPDIVHSTVRRTAREVKTYRVLRRIIRAGITAISVLLILLFVVSVLYNRTGAFSVSILKFDSVDYAISLSETPDFLDSTTILNCAAAENVDNISGTTLPADINEINGEHNGANYLAYTFYCKNSGPVAIDYTYEIYITNITQSLDKAVRVRVYVDGEYTDYARTATDGSGPEPGTEAFYTGNTIVKKTISNLTQGEMNKYTVVIWIEGDDPDTVDDKLGGEFKIDMQFAVIGSAGGQSAE